jgi:hypothetical protein
MDVGTTATNMDTEMRVTTSMTTTDVMRAWRRNVLGLAASACLLSAPWVAADAANVLPTESAVSTNAGAFGQAVKRDAKAVGAVCREGAHRVAITSKAVAHEIATAAKRGVAQTRAAFRGTKGEKGEKAGG